MERTWLGGWGALGWGKINNPLDSTRMPGGFHRVWWQLLQNIGLAIGSDTGTQFVYQLLLRASWF
ncbi:hypothetical protein [Mycoplasma sp. ATU-Cv-508]|uniref:hypothetical protein n=1 Tax=Mycoplasma sp. ATU-Cv-508 TaxID=2048001 RepID=UPI000FDD30FE